MKIILGIIIGGVVAIIVAIYWINSAFENINLEEFIKKISKR